ncbi:metallopeptidase family protein [Nocardioides sp. SYSU DS0651]|uniref:metallopeptidase family protein n=1 Tax=Nocardioides sp. SYSU DS0651 TaxID=3415955 RepID=UPI003F4C8CB8
MESGADEGGEHLARGRRRDRRGRGMRGPAVLPLVGPLGPGSVHRPPKPRSRREVFDRIMLDVVTEIEERWADRLGLVEYAVEDTPQLPDDWDSGRVPLSSLVRGSGTTPTRLVVFRRPLEHRAGDGADLAAMVLTVVVEQVAELLGIEPGEVDPRYPSDDD